MPGRKKAAPPSLLVDTNILLDVVLARTPWAGDAALLLDAIARGMVRGFVAGHAITTLHYIVERTAGTNAATTAVNDILEVLQVVPLEHADFQRALALRLADFEDAVQVAACLRAGAAVLVTRNPRDFKGAPVRTAAPAEVLASMSPDR